MATSRQDESAVWTVLEALCLVFMLFGLVAQFIHRRTPDRVVQARMASGLRSLEMENRLRAGDPFNRSRFGDTTISPQAQEALARGRGVAEAFLAKIRADNLPAAYRMTSSAFRERVGQEDFEILICNHPELKQPGRCLVFANVRFPNGSGSQMLGSPAASATTTVNIAVTEGSHGEIDDLRIAERGK